MRNTSLLVSAAAMVGTALPFPLPTQPLVKHLCGRSALTSTVALFSSSSSNTPDDLVNVTFETASGTNIIQVEKGELLRSAMLKRGMSPHNGRARLINCRGLGTCGTCAVEIISNSDSSIQPHERSTKEKLRLNFPPHGSADQSPNLRLACQVQVFDDIAVTKRTGFWGQDTAGKLAAGYDAELWFGDLEYILDNKSPPTREE
jgi:ferredoxin